jgi:hypothetical protein
MLIMDFDDFFIPQFFLASFRLPRHTCGSLAAHQNSCVVSGEPWSRISAEIGYPDLSVSVIFESPWGNVFKKVMNAGFHIL